MYPETSTLNSHDLNPFSPIVKIEALEEEEEQLIEDQLSEEQLQLSQEQDMKLSEQLEQQSEQLIKEEGEQRGKSVDLFAASEVHQGKLYRI